MGISRRVEGTIVKVCRQLGDQNIQPAQTLEPEEAFHWAVKQLELAERVVFCYEAGFSGFSLARRLQAKGIEPVVTGIRKKSFLDHPGIS